MEPTDFNSYGARRGNHEVMMRGTFANIRLREPAGAGRGGRRDGAPPTRERMSDLRRGDEVRRRRRRRCVVIAGAEYGTGSSRDWAAKGTLLLGVRAVIAKSFERIHRSNLVGMGVLPLQFEAGEDAASLGLTGNETFDIGGVAEGSPREAPHHRGHLGAGHQGVRGDLPHRHPNEARLLPERGILPFVLRQLAKA